MLSYSILFAFAILFIALLPVVMFLRNSPLFQPPTQQSDLLQSVASQSVSVLIPARNEESSIGPALDAIMRSTHRSLEVLVLDDHSEDGTAQVVHSYAMRDDRIRLIESKVLPEGWNGKQHACWQLAHHARYERLLFLDADVRLTTDAIERCLAEQQLRHAPLISGFPMQETGTIAEKLLIPLMHYVLLGYLPMDQMRSNPGVGLAAGCGQLFLAEREAYMHAGGHQAIQSSRHDGIQLPRAFRKAGFRTDIFDASTIARCRMYTSAQQVCNGLLKNATEGIANPRLIVLFSVLLLGGSVVPGLSLALGWWAGLNRTSIAVLALAFGISFVPRAMACWRFHQSWLGAVLHPLGVTCFVAIQWLALARQVVGIRTKWRGRG
jgi:glycosyltransferase involved in cell wall biosynthesis